MSNVVPFRKTVQNPITPAQLAELIVLCLSWQAKFGSRKTTWTKVDKICRILVGMGAMSRAERETVQESSAFAKELRRLVYYAAPDTDMLYTSRRPLAVQDTHMSRGVALFKKFLPYDERIHLTYAGKELAESLEQKYRHLVKKEAYLAEMQREKEWFNSLSRATRIAMFNRSRMIFDAEEAG